MHVLGKIACFSFSSQQKQQCTYRKSQNSTSFLEEWSLECLQHLQQELGKSPPLVLCSGFVACITGSPSCVPVGLGYLSIHIHQPTSRS